MYSFTNDYSEGAHPQILKAIMETNLIQNTGYSLDTHTSHAIALIRDEIKQPDADIHIIAGGTQTNLITISAALRPHQAVISPSPATSTSTKPEPLRPRATRSWPWTPPTAS